MAYGFSNSAHHRIGRLDLGETIANAVTLAFAALLIASACFSSAALV